MQFITALEVIEGENTAAPVGFTKINVDLNRGAGGKYIYLCYKKEESDTGIVDVRIIEVEERGIPAEYTKCELDVNAGTHGGYLYVSYRVGGVEESSKFGYTDIDVKDNGGDEMHYPDMGWCLNSTDLNKGAGGDYIYLVHKKASSMTMLNWMNCIADTTKLVDVCIPGTHDTMAYKFKSISKLTEQIAKTQCHNLDAQLKQGTRYLDIRFDEDLDSRHGIAVCYYNLQYVMDTVVSFLTDNPSETILIRIGAQDGVPGSFKLLMQNYIDYFWKNTDNKAINEIQLGEVRGKIVFLRGNDKLEYLKENRFGYLYGDSYIHKQDDYDNPLVRDKYKEIVDLIQEQDSSYLKLNHVSAVGKGPGALIWNPKEYADRLNWRVDQFLLEHERQKRVGVLIFDYIETNLCWAVIKHNF